MCYLHLEAWARRLCPNVGKQLSTLRCVTTQKSEDLIYTTAGALIPPNFRYYTETNKISLNFSLLESTNAGWGASSVTQSVLWWLDLSTGWLRNAKISGRSKRYCFFPNYSELFWAPSSLLSSSYRGLSPLWLVAVLWKWLLISILCWLQEVVLYFQSPHTSYSPPQGHF